MHPPAAAELPPHNPLQSGSPLAHLPNSNGACCTTHNTPQRYQALQLQLHSTVATGPRGTKQSVTNHPPPSPTCLCTIPGNLGYTAIHTLSLNARMMLSYADCHPGQILVNGTCQQLHGKTTVGPIQAQTKMRVQTATQHSPPDTHTTHALWHSPTAAQRTPTTIPDRSASTQIPSHRAETATLTAGEPPHNMCRAATIHPQPLPSHVSWMPVEVATHWLATHTHTPTHTTLLACMLYCIHHAYAAA